MIFMIFQSAAHFEKSSNIWQKMKKNLVQQRALKRGDCFVIRLVFSFNLISFDQKNIKPSYFRGYFLTNIKNEESSSFK